MIVGTVYKFFSWNAITSATRNLNRSCSISFNNHLLSSPTNHFVHANCPITRHFHDFNQLLDASKADEDLFRDDGFAGYYSDAVNNRDLTSMASAQKRSALFKELVQDIFGLTSRETEYLYLQYPTLWKRYHYKTFNHLYNLGLSKSTFLRYPWLVSFKTEEINEKLSIIHKVYEDLADISICTPLMVYSPHIIEGFMERWPIEATDFKHPSKIHFMAEAFEISVHNYLALSENKPFLLTLPHIRLDANINAMLKAGISRADIRNDLWVLQYRTKTLEDRAARLASLNMPAKPYLLRCPIKTFTRVTQNYAEFLRSENYNKDTVQFLSKELECDTFAVLAVYRICPALGKMSNSDLKNNLDLLKGRGIPLYKILATPKVLCQHFPILKYRLDVLESYNITDFKICVLHHDHKKFETFVTLEKEEGAYAKHRRIF